MNRTRGLTIVAVLVTVVATAAAARSLVRPLAGSELESVQTMTAAPAAGMPARSADSLARRTITKNPFRAHRSPANVRYRTDAAGEQVSPPPAPPRPNLSVAGIVLGSDPAALIDGIPGAEVTRVLRVGESLAGYTVRSIDTARVVIAGPDTMYHLPVRNRP